MTIGELKKLLNDSPEDTDISSLLTPTEVIRVVSDSTATDIPIDEGASCQMRHSVNIGDLFAAMGCFKKYYDITKRKVIVLQQINRMAAYYPGAVHPTLDEEGRPVTMNAKMFDMVKPLAESQEYIRSFEKYVGQTIHIDLDIIRVKTNVNLPHGPIQGWIPLAYPDLDFDISEPWIILNDKCPGYINEQVAGKVIVNFTERYREQIDYYFLQNYAPDLIFSGTEKEHWNFCNLWGLNIPRLEINNFLELAFALKAARFSLSNQSMLWNLAQAMGTKRVLEMCRFADNCFPNIGKNSSGYIYQVGAEHLFRTMYNNTK